MSNAATSLDAYACRDGEVSFDFRSNGGDETYIDPGFIVGLKASGRIIDSKSNTVVMAADVGCRRKD